MAEYYINITKVINIAPNISSQSKMTSLSSYLHRCKSNFVLPFYLVTASITL